MLSIQNVSKVYSKGAVKAVDDISLEVKDGEIFGFLGPNGAGKSTTIKMIVGILTIDSGKITVNGIDVAAESIKAKQCIGYVSDNHETFDKLTGAEYLNFIGEMYNVPATLLDERIERYLTLFEMQSAKNNIIKTYSHGMRQKIVLIASLLHEPKLLVLDEPLTGLDPQSAYQLKQLMREYTQKGNTVFFSSHVIEVVEKLCDRIAIIKHGKIIAVDTLDNIRSDSSLSLEDIFLQAVKEEPTDSSNVFLDVNK